MLGSTSGQGFGEAPGKNKHTAHGFIFRRDFTHDRSGKVQGPHTWWLAPPGSSGHTSRTGFQSGLSHGWLTSPKPAALGGQREHGPGPGCFLSKRRYPSWALAAWKSARASPSRWDSLSGSHGCTLTLAFPVFNPTWHFLHLTCSKRS